EEANKKMTMRHLEDGYRIVVGMATCGITAGARPVLNALVEEVGKLNTNHVTVTQVGCMGECALEPIVEVFDHEGNRTTYCRVKPSDAQRIVSQHIGHHQIVDDLLISKCKN
ncbi:MAG: (2Fe-2S) ferredoxin domain-containing protein, partial [Bacilli bacterium]